MIKRAASQPASQPALCGRQGRCFDHFLERGLCSPKTVNISESVAPRAPPSVNQSSSHKCGQQEQGNLMLPQCQVRDCEPAETISGGRERAQGESKEGRDRPLIPRDKRWGWSQRLREMRGVIANTSPLNKNEMQ